MSLTVGNPGPNPVRGCLFVGKRTPKNKKEEVQVGSRIYKQATPNGVFQVSLSLIQLEIYAHQEFKSGSRILFGFVCSGACDCSPFFDTFFDFLFRSLIAGLVVTPGFAQVVLRDEMLRKIV